MTADDARPGSGRPAHARMPHGLAPLTVGLALTATVLAGACTWQAREASRSARETGRESALAQAYGDIAAAANREYSAQLRFLSADRTVATDVRAVQFAQFTQARADLQAAVDRVEALGTVDDRSLATFVLMEDRQYAQNARTVFAAAEAGQLVTAQRLATTITGPRVDVLLTRVTSAAAAHERRSQESMSRLIDRSRWAAVALPASFGLALLLLGGCWVLLLRLNRAVRDQAAELLAEKQLLSTVIESSPYFVYWKDPQGHYLGANQAFEQLSGPHGPAAGTAPDRRAGAPTDAGTADPGAPGGDLVRVREVAAEPGPVGSEALVRQLAEIERQVQAAGAAVLDQQATVHSLHGQERRLLFSVLPRTGPAGSEGVIGVGVDVTRLTELERQVATAGRLESVGRLAAGLAHEINTPVQILTSNAEFVAEASTRLLAAVTGLQEVCDRPDADLSAVRALLDGVELGFLRTEVPKAITESRDCLQRITGIVLAMKDFAHVGGGYGPCRINEAVQSVVEISRHEWSGVADLQLNLDPALDLVACHEGEVKESLLAMIVNAAQAVAEKQETVPGAGRGLIGVSTRAVPGAVRIVVRDDGVGMDEAVRRKVFDPFFTTRAVGRGSGQGLNVAYGAIVVHHGGSIEVSSTPGEGSTFTITLPLRHDDRAAPFPLTDDAGTAP